MKKSLPYILEVTGATAFVSGVYLLHPIAALLVGGAAIVVAAQGIK